MSNSKFQTLCAFLFAFFLQLCAICFLLASIASAQTTFTWIAPTTNADGSALTDLGGYELGHGIASGQYTNFIQTGITTTHTANIAPGRFVAVRAVDTSGNKSIWSNEIATAATTPSASSTPTASSTASATSTATPSATPSPSPGPTPDHVKQADSILEQLQNYLESFNK